MTRFEYYKMAGNLAKEAREKAGISISQLANLLEVDSNTIVNMESGKRGYFNGYFMERVANHLNVPTQSIYPDWDKKTP